MEVATVSYNGSGTFQINTSGQPVVAGTVISSTAFNALTADLATGLSTAITKDGQTTTTARIPFAAGISSTLTTDSSSTTTGSIITAGGVGIAKALYVGTTANITGVATLTAQPILSSLTASKPVFTDASKGLVSTGTLGADQGGTGVANNAAMTVTGSGNFAYTRTLTGTTNVTFPTTGTLATLAGTETLTGKTLTSPIITNPLITEIRETATISATAATGTIAYDALTQVVLYYTTDASGNFTVNFRGNSGTSLDSVMSTGQSLSATFLVTNGATAYYNSAVQVDGSSVTPKWQGGSAPTSGNASSIDSYTYVIIKTGSAAFTVLASVTKFA
jgi:hypothetical protein